MNDETLPREEERGEVVKFALRSGQHNSFLITTENKCDHKCQCCLQSSRNKQCVELQGSESSFEKRQIFELTFDQTALCSTTAGGFQRVRRFTFKNMHLQNPKPV